MPSYIYLYARPATWASVHAHACTIKSCLPCVYPFYHTCDKMYQIFSLLSRESLETKLGVVSVTMQPITDSDLCLIGSSAHLPSPQCMLIRPGIGLNMPCMPLSGRWPVICCWRFIHVVGWWWLSVVKILPFASYILHYSSSIYQYCEQQKAQHKRVCSNWKSVTGTQYIEISTCVHAKVDFVLLQLKQKCSNKLKLLQP